MTVTEREKTMRVQNFPKLVIFEIFPDSNNSAFTRVSAPFKFELDP